jgi:electron transport complex protein RnfC
VSNIYLKPNIGGGIKTASLKSTEDSKTATLPLPKKVVIPFTHHIGAPSAPAVSKGDHVFVGTKIASSTSFISADTHSSVSGVVSDIIELHWLDGSLRPSAVIETDGEQKPDPNITPPEISTREDFVSAVQSSGLIGLGGAGFPTHVKLAKTKQPVDTLVINAAECEPYITSDYRTIVEETDEVIEGIETVLRYTDIKKAVIGIENNKPKAIELLNNKLNGSPEIKVVPLKTIYPQGAEKVLIGRVTGRAVPSGGLPADAGTIVLNVTTVSFLSKFLKTGFPLVEKRITVDGSAIAKPGNYLLPLGYCVGELAQSLGGYIQDPDRILLGGPMMGIALSSEDFPILKTTNAVLYLTKSEVSTIPNNNCIRCGRCAYGCPVCLSPVEIDTAYENGEIDELKILSVKNCIECGCCSYNCPAGRPLTQTMKLAKALLAKVGENK